MVLIVTTLGAMHAYRDHEMLCRTFRGFIGSILRQTNPNWRLFISHHDMPGWLIPPADDRIILCCVKGDLTYETTRVITNVPPRPADRCTTEVKSYGSGLTDMSRKTLNSVVEAGKWAWENEVRSFWMLRMDSDDLLAKEMVETLESLNDGPMMAVYNRTCHMFDPRLWEMAVHNYPYSTTCNAIRLEFDGKALPRWLYHCNDHTTFMRTVRVDEIPFKEIDWTLCIVTNSGNSISDRPEIAKERNVDRIGIDDVLLDRYGIGKDY